MDSRQLFTSFWGNFLLFYSWIRASFWFRLISEIEWFEDKFDGDVYDSRRSCFSRAFVWFDCDSLELGFMNLGFLWVKGSWLLVLNWCLICDDRWIFQNLCMIYPLPILFHIRSDCFSFITKNKYLTHSFKSQVQMSLVKLGSVLNYFSALDSFLSFFEQVRKEMETVDQSIA